MYTVIRLYSGQGASELFDVLENKRSEVEDVIRGVQGFVSYTLVRTSDGGVSVTVCRDKAGTDESVQVAAEWVKKNVTFAVDPPAISEGRTILHVGA